MGIAQVSPTEKLRVIIAGGGVAALEAALALRELAPENTDVTVIAPNTEFVYRPMTVREPFAYGPASHYPIAPIVQDAGATLLSDALTWVDPAGQIVHTETGEQIRYDALVLALGAKAIPRYRARDHDRRPSPGRDPARADPGHRGRLHPQPRVRGAGTDALAAAAVRDRADDRRPRIRHEHRARRDDRHPRGRALGDLWLRREQRCGRAARAGAHRDDQLRLR